MPDSMTSAEWVVAGWGFASGVMLTLCVAAPLLWRWKFRCDVTSAGAGEQRLTRVRDREAIRVLRGAVASLARRHVTPTAVGHAAVSYPPLVVGEPVDRIDHSAALVWGMLNAPGAALTVDLQGRRAETLADLAPDEERPVEDDGKNEHPRDLVTDGSMSMWRPPGRSLQPAGASLVRQLFRLGGRPTHVPEHAKGRKRVAS